MSRKAFLVDGGVVDFEHHSFETALRKADLCGFPKQSELETPLDQTLWALWVIQTHFGHRLPVYAREISEILEIRGIALNEVQIERALARAGSRVKRTKPEDDDDDRTLYKIMESGKEYLADKYARGNIRALMFDGSRPWTDRHVTTQDIAKELKGRICVLDKFYGSASLGILHHLRHGKPLQFLTAETNENHNTVLRELRDFRRECPSMRCESTPQIMSFTTVTYSPKMRS